MLGNVLLTKLSEILSQSLLVKVVNLLLLINFVIL
uniref:Uncharacterized protein n=1 Tax=Siphoviridae sp. ctqrl18 TaxID=2825681 RepID=A0A8S5NUM9_9CAUD|nr:MAG TPA: hypothetical protein [Siphoviridae sp. ctqrl18]